MGHCSEQGDSVISAPTIVTGILTGGSNSHATSSEEVNAIGTDFVSEGVVGTFTNTSGVAPATGAFACNATATPDANINISTGVAYVTATPTSQNSQSLRIKCSVTGTLAISSNSSGSTKYDWIYISVSATNAANPNTGADNVATIVASRSSSASTDDGTPPTYGYPIAVVTVANGFSTITNGNIRDVRTNCIVNLGSSSVSSGWTDLGYNPNTVTALGNRSYSLVFNSTDLTSTLSAGMRLRATRLVAAPTQVTSLSGTKYWSKATPNKFSFTDDFVIDVVISPSSYALGTIVSVYNGTSGWALRMNASGQIQLIGYNAGAANFSQVLSYQSVGLNKETRITAQLDMSAFTATTTTSYVMFDGIDVPSIVSRGGTNPTALVQAGNLNVGAENGGTNPFQGNISQLAIFNAKVTQATVLTYQHQTYAGNETSLASGYSFNGVATDLNTTTPNDLTVQNSAGYATGGTFGNRGTSSNLDYAIITKTAFSTNTTLTVQVPEGCTIPTTGGVSAVSYSTQKVPYLFPVQRGKWILENIFKANETISIGGTNTWTVSHQTLTVPIGEWVLAYEGVYRFNSGSAGVRSGFITLDSTAPTNSVYSQYMTGRVANVASVTVAINSLSKSTPASLTAQTAYTMYGAIDSATGVETYLIDASEGASIVKVENAYL